VKRVLLDLNVVLDLFLNRPAWVVDAAALWQANDAGLIQACLSIASLPTLFYVVERQADREIALKAIDACIHSLRLLSVDRAVVNRARALAGSDFEDDLQIASAIESQLDGIVTRDPSGFAHSPIAVHAPGELLKQLDAGAKPPP